SMIPSATLDGHAASSDTASAAAVRSHYDVSDDFYALWLGPTMMYSSAIWPDDSHHLSLDEAQTFKIDTMAAQVRLARAQRVLDVGCGWGGNLRRLVDEHGVRTAVGLTLSDAQHDFVAADPIPGVEIRVESWADHQPTDTYDAIVSYGAFEHFARDGMNGPER